MRAVNFDVANRAPAAQLSDSFVIAVHPSVIFKLGEDLITNDVQALIELVKNAYDADSATAAVRIETDVWTDLRTGIEIDGEDAARILREREALQREIDRLLDLGEVEPLNQRDYESLERSRDALAALMEPVRGRIVVMDQGTGMTLTDIREGWLTVSASRKREMKARGEKTAGRNRTPLGDKGLGRLGAQRLGRTLTMTTQRGQISTDKSGTSIGQLNEPILKATIFWDDFESASSLNDVLIDVVEIDGPSRVGTTLEIRGIYEPEVWLRTDAFALEGQLTTMISPYDSTRGFDVRLSINEVFVDLRDLSERVLDKATVRYALRYVDGILAIDGKLSIDYLKPPQNQDEIKIWARLIEPDNGFAFTNWLLETQPGRCQEVGLRLGDDKHFVHLTNEIVLEQLPGVERDFQTDSDRIAIDPGRFEAAVDFVQLRQNPTDAFSGVPEYRAFVKAMNGIRAYRDGFGIPVGDDWLQLAGQWSSAKSWYTLRPENVIGHVDLTAEFNAAIEETTDREAFKDTAAFRNFQNLMGVWLRSTEDAQALVRTGYNSYRRMLTEKEEGLGPSSSPQQLADQVAAQFEAMEAVASTVSEARSAMESSRVAITSLTTQQEALEDHVFVDPDIVRMNEAAVLNATLAFDRIETALRQIETNAAQIQSRRATLNLLVAQMEETQAQLREVWELVSLGITAETVAHEILNVTGRLRARSSQIAKYLEANYEDDRLEVYVEHVKSAVRSLSQQVSHLDTSLRYVRDRREKVAISTLIGESVDFFKVRFEAGAVDLRLEVINDISARVSRGKMSQVLDNLLLNSQYWVEDQISSGRANHGEIVISIDAPFVTLWDTGPGIDPNVEHSLFDPFVTRKPSNRGRGLGLFVVRQLLDSENIQIELDPARNGEGRRHKFKLDFSAALT